MSAKTRVKIKDVASLAGTSITTTSRVLSNSHYPVSAELRQKVEAAASELSFVVRQTPQASNSLNAIGLVVPTLLNPFYTQTIEGIGAVCREKGFGLLLCNSQHSQKLEDKFLHDLLSRGAKGVIISSLSEENSALPTLISRGIYAVQLDQHFELSGCDNINFDTKVGAQMAVRHLYDNGHRRIALATKQLTRWSRRRVYQGYCEQLQHFDLPVDENLIFISNETEESTQNFYTAVGNKIAQRFIDSKCGATAVFCVNDMVAVGFIQGLSHSGIKVPDDVSVVGFDDVPYAALSVPALTTIHCPSYEIGRLAALRLIDRIQSNGSGSNGATDASISVVLQPKLIERSSVKSVQP